jgi:hypothetical protein
MLTLLVLLLIPNFIAENQNKPNLVYWQEMKYPYSSLVKGETGKVFCVVTVQGSHVVNIKSCASKSVTLKAKAVQNIQTWKFDFNEKPFDFNVGVVFKISSHLCDHVKTENNFDVKSMTLFVKGWRKKYFLGSP